MPRSSTKEKDPSASNLELCDKYGIEKNSVRVSGLVKQSDTELLLVITQPSTDSEKGSQEINSRQINNDFRLAAARAMLGFRCSLVVIEVDSQCVELDFNTVQSLFAKSKGEGYLLSPFQSAFLT